MVRWLRFTVWIGVHEPEDETAMVMTFGPGAFFGYSPCGAAENAQVMWWANLPRDEEMTREEAAAVSTEELRCRLLDIYAGWHAPIEAILAATPAILKGNKHDVASLPTWHKGRVVLIGDAAHAMSPHAGEGASVALEDAMYLAKLLRQAPGELTQVLAQFERDRRPRVEKIIAQARRGADDKKVSSPFASWVRDRMLSIILRLFGERSLDWMYKYALPGMTGADRCSRCHSVSKSRYSHLSCLKRLIATRRRGRAECGASQTFRPR